MSNLLSNSKTNAKTKKMLDEFGYEGVIQYLAPHMIADGKYSVCGWSTPGCISSCLYTAGRGAMRNVQDARIRKTLDFIKNPVMYTWELEAELHKLQRRADKKGLDTIARLNGTSDIPWEEYFKMEKTFPNMQFYDYTKNIKRMRKSLLWSVKRTSWPTNYDLTFSYSENTTKAQVHEIIRKGGNVAVVFRDKIPAIWMGYDVIDGLAHDFRFLDEPGHIVGLEAKGRAKKDTTGFVVDA